MASERKDFPLYSRAEKEGLFNLDSGCLISAPTATGKSQIGRYLIRRFLETKTPLQLALYLVPYKALAEEVFSRFRKELPDGVVMMIKTSDYDTQFQFSETDLLVSTYESADALLSKYENETWPTVVVADELSIMSDRTRGVRVEALLTHLSRLKDLKMYGLSATLNDPQKVREWLGQKNSVKMLVGTKDDRPSPLDRVPKIFSKGKENAVVASLVRQSYDFGNIIVFCGRVNLTEKLALSLSSLVYDLLSPSERKETQAFAETIKSEFPYLYKIDLLKLISKGVAYHHAKLEPELRTRISEGFSSGVIKVLCASPTLSAGVNLPARTVILRDIKRYDEDTGRLELIPLSEAQNMLGRAGRPGFHEEGLGYFLMPAGYKSDRALSEFARNIITGKVEDLQSRIASSPTNLMIFILSTLSRSRGLTRRGLMDFLKSSFWVKSGNFSLPETIPARAELHKLISLLKQQNVFINGRSLRYNYDEGTVTARGGSGNYLITISYDGFDCTHGPFYRKGSVCKHHRQLAYELAEGKLQGKSREATALVFQHLDKLVESEPAAKIANALEALIEFGFVEEKKEGDEKVLFATSDGVQALVSYLLTMPHVRKLRDRISSLPKMYECSSQEIIEWCLEDLCPDSNKDGDIKRFLKRQELFNSYLEGTSIAEAYKEYPALIMPFRRSKDRMIQVFNAYAAFCPKENPELLLNIRVAKRRVSYGSPEQLHPLLVLNISGIEKASDAKTLFGSGIVNIWELSKLPNESIQTILSVDSSKAFEISSAARNKASLLQNFSLDRGVNRLSQQTGIAIEDLFDCFPEISSKKLATATTGLSS